MTHRMLIFALIIATLGICGPAPPAQAMDFTGVFDTYTVSGNAPPCEKIVMIDRTPIAIPTSLSALLDLEDSRAAPSTLAAHAILLREDGNVVVSQRCASLDTRPTVVLLASSELGLARGSPTSLEHGLLGALDKTPYTGEMKASLFARSRDRPIVATYNLTYLSA